MSFNFEVEARPGEPIDRLLQRFKSATAKSGIMAEIRKRLGYVGPSERQRMKQAMARRRASKAARLKVRADNEYKGPVR